MKTERNVSLGNINGIQHLEVVFTEPHLICETNQNVEIIPKGPLNAPVN